MYSSSSAKRQRNTNIPLDKNSSPSATFIGTDPDILSLILICLPIKRIFGCKLVSTVWLSVIINPRFQQSLEKKCRHLYSGIFIRKLFCLRSMLQEFEYNFLHKDAASGVPFKPIVFGKSTEGIRIDQSCNGLLLCSSEIRTSTWARAYYVYNPCTEQYKLMPRRRGFNDVASFSLAFDPSKSSFFKVICLWERLNGGYQIDVYSSQTSSWKNCGKNIQIEARMLTRPGVYWNGSLNWMSDQGTLVCFEVDNEIIKHFTVMPYEIDGVTKKVHYLDVCWGQLQVIVQDGIVGGSHFDVLEMDDDYTGWTLQYHLDLESQLRNSYPALVGDSVEPNRLERKVMLYDGVNTHGEGSPKLLMLIQSPIIHGVFSYDLNDKEFTRIHDLEHPCLFVDTCGMVTVGLHQITGSLARL